MSHTRSLSLLASVGFAALLCGGSSALAQAVAPPLGAAWNYSFLATNTAATSGTLTCTNSTINNGNLGTTFGSYTDIGPCTLNGTAAFVAPIPAQVKTDFNNAYSAIDSLNPIIPPACPPIPSASGAVLPGVYCSAASYTPAGAVILNLNGNASDVWIFKVGNIGSGGALTTGAGFQVVMGGGALACNVYWRTDAAATMTSSIFAGTVLSGSAITTTDGSFLGRAMATTDVTATRAAPMTFAGCAPPASITVHKSFIPTNGATVPVALTCTSGTVIATPLNASQATAAVFTVGGENPGATCTATETVPAGYTADQTNCVSVALNGSCTIVNTLIPAGAATITVNKDFIPNSTAIVPMSLTCTSGTVTTTPLNAAEGAAAVFTVTGASLGATCTATETVPAGYTADQTNCVSVALNGNCTIVNTLIPTAIENVPTLSGRSMIVLAVLLALLGFAAIRRLVT